MTSLDTRAAWLLALCVIGCGSDAGDRIAVGHEPDHSADGHAGAKSGSGGASSASAAGTKAPAGNAGGLTVHVEDIRQIEIQVVTVACAGDCADIEAVALGGNPPYAFAWEDGSADPKRHVCLDDDSTLSVSTTDTSITDDEFRYEAQTVSTELTAHVLECSDGGVCEGGGGPLTPESGHYEGAGTYVCDNDMDPATAMAINNATIAIDLVIDPDSAQQTGHFFLQWGLVVITAEGELDGALACGTGEFVSSLIDGIWGLPGDGPMVGIVTGAVTGQVTAQKAGGDGSIAGTFHWMSSYPDGSRSNDCLVTYEAMLKP